MGKMVRTFNCHLSKKLIQLRFKQVKITDTLFIIKGHRETWILLKNCELYSYDSGLSYLIPVSPADSKKPVQAFDSHTGKRPSNGKLTGKIYHSHC